MVRLTQFDSVKRFVLIEKAPFLIAVNEYIVDRFCTDKYYMVRNLNRFDYEKAQIFKSVVRKNDFYMIVDFGSHNSYKNNFIGCIIHKDDVVIMNSHAKLS